MTFIFVIVKKARYIMRKGLMKSPTDKDFKNYLKKLKDIVDKKINEAK